MVLSEPVNFGSDLLLVFNSSSKATKGFRIEMKVARNKNKNKNKRKRKGYTKGWVCGCGRIGKFN